MKELVVLNSNVELDLLTEMELLDVLGGDGVSTHDTTNMVCPNIYCPSPGAPACSGGSTCGGNTCGGNTCGGSTCGSNKPGTGINGNNIYLFSNCKGH